MKVETMKGILEANKHRPHKIHLTNGETIVVNIKKVLDDCLLGTLAFRMYAKRSVEKEQSVVIPLKSISYIS